MRDAHRGRTIADVAGRVLDLNGDGVEAAGAEAAAFSAKLELQGAGNLPVRTGVAIAQAVLLLVAGEGDDALGEFLSRIVGGLLD